MAACRELTKIYEEIRRGTISEVKAHFSENQPRGEFVLVVAGKSAPEQPSVWEESALIAAIQSEIEKGKPAKQISAELAEKSGWGKKEIYALVNELK